MRYTDFNGTKVSKLCLGNMRFPLDEGGEPIFDTACAKDFIYLWGDLKEIYQNLGPNAADCIECGACERKCPQHIAIPEMLKKIDERYRRL